MVLCFGPSTFPLSSHILFPIHHSCFIFSCSSQIPSFPISQLLDLLFLLPGILLPKTFCKDQPLRELASPNFYGASPYSKIPFQMHFLSVHRIISKHIIGIHMHLLYKIFRFSVTAYPLPHSCHFHWLTKLTSFYIQ